ncbi:hypothetical protein MKX03_006041, partial [Papaver bracteatum]
MISHHGSIDSLLFLKPVVIILSILMLHACVCIAQENNREGYEKCKNNFTCGSGVNVGYPFWGEHHNTDDGKDRPEYCGLPGYKLDCYDGDVAEIQFSDELYRVLEINPDSQVMNITNKDLVDDACASKSLMTPYGSDVFKSPSPDAYQLIYIYSDCSDTNIQDPYKFNCQINDAGPGSTSSSDAYFLLTDTPASGLLSCRKTVNVPIMKAFLKDLIAKPETLPTVIKQGFNVTYDAESGSSIGMCLTCRGNGGICGYNITAKSPTCFLGMFFSSSFSVHALPLVHM